MNDVIYYGKNGIAKFRLKLNDRRLGLGRYDHYHLHSVIVLLFLQMSTIIDGKTISQRREKTPHNHPIPPTPKNLFRIPLESIII